jgi:hypothetical protein
MVKIFYSNHLTTTMAINMVTPENARYLALYFYQEGVSFTVVNGATILLANQTFFSIRERIQQYLKIHEPRLELIEE